MKLLAWLAIGCLLGGCVAPYFPSESLEEYEARQARARELEERGLMLEISRPIVQQFDDRRNWVLHDEVPWTPRDDVEHEIVVPAGFVTDFASVPRIVWPLVAPVDDIGTAGVIHDYLYWIGDPACTRVEADKLMLLAMIELDVGSIRQNVVYRALRWFGGRAWKDNEAERTAGEFRIVPASRIHLPPRMLGEPGLTWKHLRLTLKKELPSPEPLPHEQLPLPACREVDSLLESARAQQEEEAAKRCSWWRRVTRRCGG